MMPNPRSIRRRAFTLVDSLAATAIAAAALGLLLPTVQKGRSSSGAQKSANNIKQMVLACHNYEASYGCLPPLMGGGKNFKKDGEYLIAGGSSKFWNVYGPTPMFLLPYVEQDTLYKQMLNPEKSTYDPYYNRFADTKSYMIAVPQYISPEDPSHKKGLDAAGRGITSYGANAELFAVLSRDGLIAKQQVAYFDRGLAIAQIQDGSSNTVMFAEKFGSCGNGGSLWSGNIDGTGKKIDAVPANAKETPYLWPAFGLGGGEGFPSPAYSADPKYLAEQTKKDAKTPESRILFQTAPKWDANKTFADKEDAAGCDAYRASSASADFILVGMCDGSATKVSKKVTPQVWFYALHPADGESYKFEE